MDNIDDDLLPLVEDYFRSGAAQADMEAIHMEQSVIRQLQDEAAQVCERLPQPEAAQCAQVAMLAEIALQLAKLNEHLEHKEQAGTHPPDCDCYYCSAESR